MEIVIVRIGYTNRYFKALICDGYKVGDLRVSKNPVSGEWMSFDNRSLVKGKDSRLRTILLIWKL